MQIESITILKQLGVQIERTSYHFSSKKVFIPLEKIESILINEGFHLNQVIYYMAVLVKNESTAQLPFQVCNHGNVFTLANYIP